MFQWINQIEGSFMIAFALIGYLLAGALGYSNIRWRLQNLESRQTVQEKIMEQQATLAREVELNNMELKQIAKATERRLQLLEDRNGH